MVATALNVLSLEEAKRQLGVQHAEFDTLITESIEQAVSVVGRRNGVPLVDEDRMYELMAYSGSEDAAEIRLPVGWPKPVETVSFTYLNALDEAATVTTAEAALNSEYLEFGPDRWAVRPEVFGLTDWPTGHRYSVTVKVGVSTIPERVQAAVVVACRALYRAQPVPSDAIGALLA